MLRKNNLILGGQVDNVTHPCLEGIKHKNCVCNNKDNCYIKLAYARNSLLSNEAINVIRKSYLYEGNIQDLFAKVAVEYSYDCQHAQRMYDYISNLIFMPSTPVLRTINGVDLHPISCFANTLNNKEIEQCLDKFKEICIQLHGGGGCSVNLSHIAHQPEKKLFTDIAMYIHCGEALHEFIRKQIPRKSAICYYLNVSHPDIKRFIAIRKPTFEIEKINISARTHIAVIISKEFMDCVQQNLEWQLINPNTKKIVESVNARELWINIIQCRFETGEPFIYFEHNVEQYKPEVYKKLNVPIGCSNLCTEIFIPCDKDHNNKERNGVCCLGSLNLVMFYSKQNIYNKYQIVKDSLLFLDCILTKYASQLNPVKESATILSIEASRAVGLGVMGWHSYLLEQMIPFDSEEAFNINKEVFTSLKEFADKASLELGEELGHCPDNIDAGLKGRFTLKIAIAPNSHISQIAGVSPGINPVVSNYYQLKSSSLNTIRINQKLLEIINQHYLENRQEILQHMLKNGGSIANIPYIDPKFKNIFKTAYEISQEIHIKICGERNKILDGEQGQSINLYLHKDMTFGDIIKLHMLAYKSGVKTLYYLHNTPQLSSDNDSNLCLSCI